MLALLVLILGCGCFSGCLSSAFRAAQLAGVEGLMSPMTRSLPDAVRLHTKNYKQFRKFIQGKPILPGQTHDTYIDAMFYEYCTKDCAKASRLFAQCIVPSSQAATRAFYHLEELYSPSEASSINGLIVKKLYEYAARKSHSEWSRNKLFLKVARFQTGLDIKDPDMGQPGQAFLESVLQLKNIIDPEEQDLDLLYSQRFLGAVGSDKVCAYFQDWPLSPSPSTAL